MAEQLRGDSRSAMTEAFQVHLDAVYNYCYRRTGSWSAAEDLSSTVFLEVWKARHRAVELDGSILPWLYGVATNVCRNHVRSQHRRRRTLTSVHLDDVDLGAVTDDVVDQIDANRRLAAALRRLRELPQTEQDVFHLVCWEQLSYAAAATALDIPIGTVRSRLSRVRRTLRLADDQENADV